MFLTNLICLQWFMLELCCLIYESIIVANWLVLSGPVQPPHTWDRLPVQLRYGGRTTLYFQTLTGIFNNIHSTCSVRESRGNMRHMQGTVKSQSMNPERHLKRSLEMCLYIINLKLYLVALKKMLLNISKLINSYIWLLC